MSDIRHDLSESTVLAPEFVLRNLEKKRTVNRTLREGRIAIITDEPGTGKTWLSSACRKKTEFIKPCGSDDRGHYLLSADDIPQKTETVFIIDDAFLFNADSLKTFAGRVHTRKIKLIITSLSPDDVPDMHLIADHIRLERH